MPIAFKTATEAVVTIFGNNFVKIDGSAVPEEQLGGAQQSWLTPDSEQWVYTTIAGPAGA